MTDAHYEQILSNQLAMNRQTWEVLKRHGVTEQSHIRLDFSYDAPNRDSADSNGSIDSATNGLRCPSRVERLHSSSQVEGRGYNPEHYGFSRNLRPVGYLDGRGGQAAIVRI